MEALKQNDLDVAKRARRSGPVVRIAFAEQNGPNEVKPIEGQLEAKDLPLPPPSDVEEAL
jgi:hypothetical protein